MYYLWNLKLMRNMCTRGHTLSSGDEKQANLPFLGPSDLIAFQPEFLEPGEGPSSTLTHGMTSDKLLPFRQP